MLPGSSLPFREGGFALARHLTARQARGLLVAMLDLVYPRHCMACRHRLRDTEEAWLCARCLERMPEIGDDQCSRCGDTLGPHSGRRRGCPSCQGRSALFFRGAVAACQYEATARDIVHKFKYEGDLRAVDWMATKVTEKLRRTDWFHEVDGIAPVPLHWTRRTARRFNQSLLLGRAIAHASEKPLIARALSRTRRTEPQAFLSPSQRRENVRGAFKASRPQRIRGKTLLLVDDVMTTCATAAECARALVKAGARNVYAAVFAR